MTSRSLIRAVGVLAALAVVTAPIRAQDLLFDSTAWEHLGEERFRYNSVRDFGFSGDPATPTVWVGDGGGLYRLDRIDGPWTLVERRAWGSPVFFFNDPVSAAGPDTLFAGFALYRSIDGGRTFEKVVSPAGGESGTVGSGSAGTGLARFPRGSPYSGRLVVGDWPGALSSDDGGDTWTRAESPYRIDPFQAHAFRSGRALMAGFYGAVLSLDGGRTYRPVPALYDTTTVDGRTVPRFDLTELAVLDGFTADRPGSSPEGRVLLVGTTSRLPGRRVWASDDEGDSWRDVHAFDGAGIGGLTTVPASVGGGPGWAITVERFGPPKTLPYGEWTESRVFATVDGGETWAEIGLVPGTGNNVDGGTTSVKAAAVGPDGRLYVGTARTGPKASWSWRTREPVAAAVRFAVAAEPGESGPPPDRVGVYVYPNPAGREATVTVTLASPADIRVAVFDVRGRAVAEVAAGPLAAGERQWRIDTAGWAVGVYAVRVEAGGHMQTARLTVIR